MKDLTTAGGRVFETLSSSCFARFGHFVVCATCSLGSRHVAENRSIVSYWWLLSLNFLSRTGVVTIYALIWNLCLIWMPNIVKPPLCGSLPLDVFSYWFPRRPPSGRTQPCDCDSQAESAVRSADRQIAFATCQTLST